MKKTNAKITIFEKDTLRKKQEKEKDLEGKRGVTLVALIVTIIVLLILAGVTIATLTGENGILTRADEAKEQTEIASFQEHKQLICNGARMQKKDDVLQYLTKEFQKIDSNAKIKDTGNGYYINCKGERFLYDYDFNEYEVNEGSESDWTYTNNDDGSLNLLKYNKTVNGKIVFPNFIDEKPIKGIGNDIFFDNQNLTDIEISYGIEKIGNQAFKQCYNLECELQIPSSIIDIGNQAFYDCKKLKGDITDVIRRLNSINSGIFYNCENIRGSIKFKDRITTIGERAFYNCKNLDGYLYVPSSVNDIRSGAFVNCENLKGDITTTIKNLDSINSSIFFGCSKLTGSIIIKDGIQNISDNAFKGCTSLNGDIVLPQSLKTISGHAFENCSNLSGKLVVGENLEVISDYAFYNCNALNSIKYAGDSTQWEKISIGINNFILYNLDIEYNYKYLQ